MRSTLAAEIEAPPELVFALARGLERWPDLLPHYLAVRVLERHPDGALTARMVALRPIVPRLGYGLPVAWRARTWSDPASLQLRFVHQGGATDGMDVTWRIEPTTSGCRVSIDHDFRPRVPGWGVLVNRLFVGPIATRTLATFKAIAEAVEQSGVAAGETATRASPRSASRRSANRSI
jgi:ribosome-associated toxin RatA of RatAB toxin-antitoxin module